MRSTVVTGATVFRDATFRRKAEGLGLPFLLTLVYLFVEYARPANPMKIPLTISILLFLSWAMLRDKKWSPQATCFLALLGVIAVTGPFAVNGYSAWWGFVAMTVQLLFICIPTMNFISSLRKLTIFVGALLAVYSYVAIYGLLHAGQGPGGHIGDENDLALALNMVIPYAYMSLFFVRQAAQKTLFLGALGLMVATVIATFSRGGFLGLLSVLVYCLLMSPKKKLAVTVGLVLAVGVLSYAPSSYWDRLATIVVDARDTESGTGALRREFWMIARTMFYDNPIFGVGFKNFPWNASLYEPADQMDRVGRSYAGTAVHSVYFAVLSELGLSGALIFLAIVAYNIRDTRRVIRWCAIGRRRRWSAPGAVSGVMEEAIRRDLDKATGYARAMQASMLGYLVSGIFLSAFDYPHFWILTAAIVALKEATAEVLKGIGGTPAPASPRRLGTVP